MTRLGNEFANVDPRGWKLEGRTPLAGGHFPITFAMWDALSADIKKYGVRNTYLRANMPTVNTGDILGSSGPSTEPVNFNVFNKTTVGSNKLFKFDDNMIKHLTELGVWSQQIADAVVSDPFGRLPHIDIPGWASVREIYLTAYEISQAELIRRSGMRQAFIDQTQSFNQFLNAREVQKLRGIIELGFRYGLKTISYYTRMLSADKTATAVAILPADAAQVCRRDNPDCAACQS
jgi:ribonucleotide reductase alpha subunit